jgi:hypothetical protein
VFDPPCGQSQTSDCSLRAELLSAQWYLDGGPPICD